MKLVPYIFTAAVVFSSLVPNNVYSAGTPDYTQDFGRRFAGRVDLYTHLTSDEALLEEGRHHNQRENEPGDHHYLYLGFKADGDELFTQVTEGNFREIPDGPLSWLLARRGGCSHAYQAVWEESASNHEDVRRSNPHRGIEVLEFDNLAQRGDVLGLGAARTFNASGVITGEEYLNGVFSEPGVLSIPLDELQELSKAATLREACARVEVAGHDTTVHLSAVRKLERSPEWRKALSLWLEGAKDSYQRFPEVADPLVSSVDAFTANSGCSLLHTLDKVIESAYERNYGASPADRAAWVARFLAVEAKKPITLYNSTEFQTWARDNFFPMVKARYRDPEVFPRLEKLIEALKSDKRGVVSSTRDGYLQKQQTLLSKRFKVVQFPGVGISLSREDYRHEAARVHFDEAMGMYYDLLRNFPSMNKSELGDEDHVSSLNLMRQIHLIRAKFHEGLILCYPEAVDFHDALQQITGEIDQLSARIAEVE